MNFANYVLMTNVPFDVLCVFCMNRDRNAYRGLRHVPVPVEKPGEVRKEDHSDSQKVFRRHFLLCELIKMLT